MQDNIWPLILFAAAAILVIGGLAMLSQHYTLDNIKSRTVGDGQYGTARWATPKEISKTYQNIPFTPQVWRNGKQRPQAQGLVLGSVGKPPVPPELHLFGGPFTRRSPNGSGRTKRSTLWWTATTSTA